MTQGDERIDLRSVQRFIQRAVEAGAIDLATAKRLGELARALGGPAGTGGAPAARIDGCRGDPGRRHRLPRRPGGGRVAALRA